MKLVSAYPIQLICQVLGYPRSSYYYQSIEGDDPEIEAAIEALAESWPKYGYRRIAVQLRREKQLAVNSKRVRRLMRKKGLQAQIQRKKRRTTNSEHEFPRYSNLVQQREVVRPDEVWVADITSMFHRPDLFLALRG